MGLVRHVRHVWSTFVNWGTLSWVCVYDEMPRLGTFGVGLGSRG